MEFSWNSNSYILKTYFKYVWLPENIKEKKKC